MEEIEEFGYNNKKREREWEWSGVDEGDFMGRWMDGGGDRVQGSNTL